MSTPTLLLTLLLCCQTAVSDAAEPSHLDEVEQAIQDLSGASFAAREEATRRLWKLGRRAEPALQAVLAGGNLESRQRAQQIVADFAYGITPDAPAQVVRTLRQFRDGSARERSQLFSTLIDRGDQDLLSILLARTEDARVREAVFTQSVLSTEMMIRLIQSDQLDEWIATAAPPRLRDREREILANWLTSEGVIATLEDRELLPLVDEVILREPEAIDRYQLLRRLLVQREFVDFFSSPRHLRQLLGMIGSVDDANYRHELLLRFLSMTHEVTILGSPSTGELLRFASERGTRTTLAAVWDYLLVTLLNREEIVARLTTHRLQEFAEPLDDDKFDRLLQTLGESDAGRGWLGDSAHRVWVEEWAGRLSPPRQQRLRAWLTTQTTAGSATASVDPRP